MMAFISRILSLWFWIGRSQRPVRFSVSGSGRDIAGHRVRLAPPSGEPSIEIFNGVHDAAGEVVVGRSLATVLPAVKSGLRDAQVLSGLHLRQKLPADVFRAHRNAPMLCGRSISVAVT